MEKILSNPLFFSVVVAAVVSAIVTFVLNIFLERFKFKHQYRQFYANRKLLGCEELCSAISKVLADYFAIRGIIADTKDPKELTEFQSDFITDFIKDMKNQLEAILKNLGYLSPELREEMVKYISTINSESLSLQTLYEEHTSSEQYITTQFDVISEKLAEEMKRNPYERRWRATSERKPPSSDGGASQL